MRLQKRNWLHLALLAVVLLVMIMIRYKGYFYTRAYPAFQQVEGRRIVRSLDDYIRLDAEDFFILYTASDEAAALQLEEIITGYGEQVLGYFRHHRSQPIGVVLYPHETELKGMLRIPQEMSAMGAYAGGKINLLSPNRFESLKQRDESLINLFVHELAHLVVDDIAKGNYPLWFTEGSALYLEYVILGYEWGSELADETLYTVADLTYRFADLNEYKAYRDSFLLVRGLVEVYGWDQYLALLEVLGRGISFDQAFWDVFAAHPEDLQQYPQWISS